MEEKLKMTVIRALNLSPDSYRSDLKLGDVNSWDSLGHLNLIFSIEDAFNLQFASERVPKLTSLQLILHELSQIKG